VADAALGWSHRQVLRHLCESEAVERGQKRTARLLAESGLPEGKTLSSLDEALLPPKVRRQLSALIEGSFVERSVTLLISARNHGVDPQAYLQDVIERPPVRPRRPAAGQLGRRESRRSPRDQVGAPASRLKPAILATCAHSSERIQTADARGLTHKSHRRSLKTLRSSGRPTSKHSYCREPTPQRIVMARVSTQRPSQWAMKQSSPLQIR
jgi:hypothetical protein